MNKTKQKQTPTYREQANGWQRGEGWERWAGNRYKTLLKEFKEDVN